MVDRLPAEECSENPFRARCVALGILSVLAVSVCRAESVLNVINLIESARSSALGDVVAAAENDVTSVWHNPVAASGATDPSITLAGQRGFIEDVTWQALGVLPVGVGKTLAAGIAYYDAGTVPGIAGPGGGRINAQRDIMGLAGASLDLASWMSAGVSVKAVHSKLVDRFSSSAVAVDIGVRFKYTEDIRVGMVVHNLGKDVSYLNNQVPLGRALRVGGSLRMTITPGLPDERNDVFLLGDAVYLLDDDVVDVGIGIEYRWRQMFAVRGGMNTRNRTAGAVRYGGAKGSDDMSYSLGIGLTVRRYRVDYAARLGSGAGFPQVFSLTVGF